MSSFSKKIPTLRKVTLALVFIAVIVSLAVDSGLGTPCSFGIDKFFLLCPLGAIEAMIASKSIVPVTLISLAVMLVFSLLFGRAWCAWGCPAPVIRRFFGRDPGQRSKASSDQGDTSADGGEPQDAAGDASACACDGTNCGNSGGANTCESCAAMAKAFNLKASVKHVGCDRRTWVLIGVLIATFIAGFPIFCLVCPIGLTFGTVGSLWHFFVDKQITMSCLVFPAALLIELVLYRKWCVNLCPVAGLLNIFGQFARFGRPRINEETCLRCTGAAACDVCTRVCAESIDKHSPAVAQALGECTRCGECAKHCPTASIELKI